MKTYPEISDSRLIWGNHCIGFNKIDGSNLRWEWQCKKGFVKQGTRNILFDETAIIYSPAIPIFLNKYAENLERIFYDNKYFRNTDKITVFTEYFGPDSFAGWHNPENIINNEMDLILFDVDIYKKGLLHPNEFIKYFGNLHIPEIIYEGNFNKELIFNVRHGNYNVDEGIVCKGTRKSKKRTELLFMQKIKTLSWLKKLKKLYRDEKEFNERK